MNRTVSRKDAKEQRRKNRQSEKIISGSIMDYVFSLRTLRLCARKCLLVPVYLGEIKSIIPEIIEEYCIMLILFFSKAEKTCVKTIKP